MEAAANETAGGSSCSNTMVSGTGNSGQLELIELLPLEYTRGLSLTRFLAASVPKSLGTVFIKFLATHSPLGQEFIHLKRVRPSPPPAAPGTRLDVLVCRGDVEPPQGVIAYLNANDCGVCFSVDVSTYAALTRAQLADFSPPWPLTYRKPSFMPLELTAAAREKYAQLLRRAEQVGAGRCACVIVDSTGVEIAAATEEASAHPLRHAVMVAIGIAAKSFSDGAVVEHDVPSSSSSKRQRTAEDVYLCQDCEVITTHEPCIMCAMALVHSRVHLIAFREPDPGFGGFGGAVALHTCQSLNHQLRAFRFLEGR
mmetsp:Transcript_118985/g.237192  ORF Transcript_118985/g.237192 Transcript_118985/m.237192 type:complete len:312 (+) Transcript_118985:26-961(+)